MVWEKNAHACGFQTGEELRRPCDAAEGKRRTSEDGEFHVTAHAPERSLPTKGTEFCLERNVASCGNRARTVARRAARRGFAQIAGRQKCVVKVDGIEEKNVEVAVKAAMPKAIVQNMRMRGCASGGERLR